MPGFDVVLLAVDDYPDPPGPLPASTSARRFGELLRDGGGRVTPPVVISTREQLLNAIDAWADDESLTSSVVYLVGHGTGDSLDHEFLVPGDNGVARVRTAMLAAALQRDWVRRQGDPTSWTLFVLDCCDSELGVVNIYAELAGKYPKKPKHLRLWPVAPGGGARTGAFVRAFEDALGKFTENDTVIPLDEVFRRMGKDLGDLAPEGNLPPEACLVPARPAAPVVMPLDVHAELHRAIKGQPADVRNHFLAKAQGSEVGEVVWHFSGRGAEVAHLCDWLAGDGAMKVVTGEAGSGKSALLGHLVVLADPLLVRLYVDSRIAPHLADSPRPPDHVFRAVVHLTGKTAAEAIGDIAAQLWPGWVDDEKGGLSAPDYAAVFAGDSEQFAQVAQALGVSRAPVLVDALDESQDPLPIAAFLREMAERGVLRVVVGTRRSTGEGPDQPTDPSRRELLDALGASDDDVVVVERDASAVRDYVMRRLSRGGSAYGDNHALIADAADRIAGFDQPFLFARLATAEMYARAISVDDATMGLLREDGHRGLFAFALNRIAAADPAVYDMLRALAYARGRGLPQAGGIWVDAARAVSGRDLATEDTIESVVALAGPYVTLDGEAGQSTYRLAHQTFVEHFHAQDGYGYGHRRIATALVDRQFTDRWVGANYYAVRYAPEHFVADADRTAPATIRFADLVTDPGWLVRAVGTLGVSRTVDIVGAPRRLMRATSMLEVVTILERALRRSRTALAGHPDQLPGQLHARLRDERAPALAGIGPGCAAVAGLPWLRMTEGSLDWRADIETTYGLVGKVRGLGFGEVEERPLVAIAIERNPGENAVVLWDPRQGTRDEASVVELGSKRATAVTIANIGGRTVVVTTAAYEQSTDIWDAHTGANVGSAPVSLGTCVEVGPVGDRLVVAGLDQMRRPVLLDAHSLAPVKGVVALRERDVRGFALHEGELVALCLEEAHVAAVDPVTGEEVWRSHTCDRIQDEVEVLVGRDLGAEFLVNREFLVVAGVGRDVVWLTGNSVHVESSAYGTRMSALTIGSVERRHVVVSVPDLDTTTALVELHEVARTDRSTGPAMLFRPRSVTPSGDVAPPGFWLPDALVRSSPVAAFSLDRPEEWPHTASAQGQLDGRPVLVTGSVEGAVWVWDLTGNLRPIAGPLVTVSPTTLGRGTLALGSKPSVATVDSIAFAHHSHFGPIVAAACEGAVRVYTVPGGEPIPAPGDDGTVIDAVALARIGDRDVLVTGSKGGGLTVWGLAPPEHIAALTLDDPIVNLRVRDDGTIVADTGAGRSVAVELVQP